MQLMIDLDTETVEGLRFAAKFLIDIATHRGGKDLNPQLSKTPAADPRPVTLEGAVKVPPPPLTEAPPPPPPPNNILPFAPPPPPPATAPATVEIAQGSGISVAAIPPVISSSAIGASIAATLEYDSAGMPWDARIHQKQKSRKKDGTWKLQKGIDQNLVQSVVAALAGLRQTPSAVQQTSSFVSGQPSSASVAVLTSPPPPPPPANVPLASPPPPANVPLASPPPPPSDAPSPAAASGSVTYRQLLDKITAATVAQKLTPLQVAQIVQQNGAPNVTALKGMAHLIPEVNADIDAAILGL